MTNGPAFDSNFLPGSAFFSYFLIPILQKIMNFSSEWFTKKHFNGKMDCIYFNVKIFRKDSKKNE